MPETFDIDTLAEELELDSSDVIELYQDFREYLKTTLPKLEQSVQSSHYSECRHHAHAIKGSAGNLRIHSVYDTSLLLQEAAEHEDDTRIEELWKQLKLQCEQYLEESAQL